MVFSNEFVSFGYLNGKEMEMEAWKQALRMNKSSGSFIQFFSLLFSFLLIHAFILFHFKWAKRKRKEERNHRNFLPSEFTNEPNVKSVMEERKKWVKEARKKLIHLFFSFTLPFLSFAY